MLEYKNGFLCVPNEETGGSDVVLVKSAEKLVEKLGYALPVPDVPLRQNGLWLHKRPEEAAEAEPEIAVDAEDPSGVKKEEGEKEEGGGDDKDETIPEADVPYQKLQRIQNVVNFLFKTYDDLRTFRHREGPPPEGGKAKQSFNRKKTEALEKQRARLQKQQKQKRESATASGNEADMEGDDEKDHVDADGVDADADDDLRTVDESWTLIARVLNSIKVLAPVLLTAFHHERHADTDLKIHGHKVTSNKKRQQYWFLGEYVYDIVSTQSYTRLLECMEDILFLIGVPTEEANHEKIPVATVIEQTKKRIDTLMEEILTLSQSGGKNPAWLEALPFDALPAKAAEMAPKLDTKFELGAEAMARDQDEHDKYLKSIEKLRARVEEIVQEKHKDAKVSIYGSCLSDLSLGRNADVDLSLHVQVAADAHASFEKGDLPAPKYSRSIRNIIMLVKNKLSDKTDEFGDLEAVTRARVPVVKGTFKKADNPHSDDGSIHFDVCLLNEIAVVNSGLIKEYSIVDPRVRSLMIAVKKWASENGISTAQNNFFSSYTWVNLVIYYLEIIGFVPNLQSAELMSKVGFSQDPANELHNVKNLNTAYMTWESVKSSWSVPDKLKNVSVTTLLYGFFQFYANTFPAPFYMVSIKRAGGPLLPKTLFRRCNFFLCVEDPFETYDSHMPHNLGVGAGDRDRNVHKIITCLKEAAKHMEGVLVGTDDVGSVERLWPEPAAADEGADGAPKQDRQRKGRGRGRDRRGQQQGGRKKAGEEDKEGGEKKKGRGGRNRKGKEGAVEPATDTEGEGGGAKSDTEAAQKKGGRNRKGRNKKGGGKGDAGAESGAETDKAEAKADSGDEGGDAKDQQQKKKRQRNRNRKGGKGEGAGAEESGAEGAGHTDNEEAGAKSEGEGQKQGGRGGGGRGRGRNRKGGRGGGKGRGDGAEVKEGDDKPKESAGESKKTEGGSGGEGDKKTNGEKGGEGKGRGGGRGGGGRGRGRGRGRGGRGGGRGGGGRGKGEGEKPKQEAASE